MRRASDFSSVVGRGVRARRGCLVVHHVPCLDSDYPAPRVGLVVGKSVGGSVVRHRLSRRLRAQLSQRLDLLPSSSATVVRALPDAAGADSVRLGHDLDAAFARLRMGVDR